MALMSLSRPMMRVERWGGAPSPGRRRRRYGPGKGGDEGIASARDVDDVTRLVLPIGKHLAKSGDMDTKAAFFDNHIRPNARKQLPLGHDFPGALDKRDEDVEFAAADLHRRLALQQPAFGGEKPKRAELRASAPRVHLGRHRGVVASTARRRFYTAETGA